MADEAKVLGQLDAAATTTEVLYTVPNLAQTYISLINVCNRNATSTTYRMTIHVAGALADNKQYIRYDRIIAGNSHDSIDGIVLNEGDVIKTYAGATGLSFNVFGIETT